MNPQCDMVCDFILKGSLHSVIQLLYQIPCNFRWLQNKAKMPLEFLFGKKKTPEEMLRQNQRALTKAMRDLDRERAKMEQQEKKVIADIKKMAKQGQMVSRTCRIEWLFYNGSRNWNKCWFFFYLFNHRTKIINNNNNNKDVISRGHSFEIDEHEL